MQRYFILILLVPIAIIGTCIFDMHDDAHIQPAHKEYYPCVPPTFDKDDVKFFQVTDGTPAKRDSTKFENLRLWQQQTSEAIPLTAIDEIVYCDFLKLQHYSQCSNKVLRSGEAQNVGDWEFIVAI